MRKNNHIHEIRMLILIYVVGLTSTMSLALEAKQSPVTILAASTIENTMEKIHKQDRKDMLQNREEVHDDKCYAYRQQLAEIEERIAGKDNSNPRDSAMNPTETSMKTTEGQEKDDLLIQARVLREQIQQYCTY